MTSIRMITTLSALALVALAYSNAGAMAGPIVPPGHYCLEEAGEGITDCSFTSQAQCLHSASGTDAECYGPAANDDRARVRRHGQG